MSQALANVAKLVAPIVIATVAAPAAAQEEGEAEAVTGALSPAPPAPPSRPQPAPRPTRGISIPPPAPPPPPPISKARPAKAPSTFSQYEWFQDVVLPASLYRQQAEGLVMYSVKINAEGAVTDCTVTDSSGFPELDALTCEIVREKARFDPALDQDGEPTLGSFSSYKRWSFRPHDLNDFSFTIRATIRVDGTAINCRVVEQAGTPPMGFKEEDPCKGLFRQEQPWRDENGEPQPRVIEFSMNVKTWEPPAPLVIEKPAAAERPSD